RSFFLRDEILAAAKMGLFSSCRSRARVHAAWRRWQLPVDESRDAADLFQTFRSERYRARTAAQRGVAADLHPSVLRGGCAGVELAGKLPPLAAARTVSFDFCSLYAVAALRSGVHAILLHSGASAG